MRAVRELEIYILYLAISQLVVWQDAYARFAQNARIILLRFPISSGADYRRRWHPSTSSSCEFTLYGPCALSLSLFLSWLRYDTAACPFGPWNYFHPSETAINRRLRYHTNVRIYDWIFILHVAKMLNNIVEFAIWIFLKFHARSQIFLAENLCSTIFSSFLRTSLSSINLLVICICRIYF